MKKTKENKKQQKLNVREFDDIIRTAERTPEPPCEFTDEIPMGKRDEMIEKIISESNKDE